jgi:uncharacterized protein YjbJ (UPF0337 family)
MTDQIISAGRWNSLKGEVKSRWGALTDNDLQQIGGNIDKLIGTVERKTGETRQNVEQWLRNQGYADMLSDAAQKGAQYAGQVRDRLKEYSWSDLADVLKDNIILTVAGTLLLGFALGRVSKPNLNARYARRWGQTWT